MFQLKNVFAKLVVLRAMECKAEFHLVTRDK